MGNFTNGGFESGDLTGWATGSDEGIYTFAVQTTIKYEGSYALQIDHPLEYPCPPSGPYRCFATCGFTNESASKIYIYFRRANANYPKYFQVSVYDTEGSAIIDTDAWTETDMGGSWYEYTSSALGLETASNYYILAELIDEALGGEILAQYTCWLDFATIEESESEFTEKQVVGEYHIVDSTTHILNGDFETGDFTSWSTTTSNGTLSIGTDYKYEGSYGCLLYTSATGLTSFQESYAKITQSIDGTTGDPYKVKFYYKVPYSKDYSSDSGLFIQYRYQDNNLEWHTTTLFKVDCSQTDWRCGEAIITADPSQELSSATNELIFKVSSYQGSSITNDCVVVYLDNITISNYIGDLPSDNILTKNVDSPYAIHQLYFKNGGFEDGLDYWTVTKIGNPAGSTSTIFPTTEWRRYGENCCKLEADTRGLTQQTYQIYTLSQTLNTIIYPDTIYIKYFYAIPSLYTANALTPSVLAVWVEEPDGNMVSLKEYDTATTQYDWATIEYTRCNTYAPATLRFQVRAYSDINGKGYVKAFVDGVYVGYEAQSDGSPLMYATCYYDIRYPESFATFKYGIELNTTFEGDYSIGETTPSTMISYYNITHSANTDYLLDIWDPIFPATKFYNLELTKKIMQVDTLSVVLFDVASSSATLLNQGTPMRLRVNGRFMYPGIIKRVERDDNKRTWGIWSESNASLLRDYKIQANKYYTNSYILQTIIPALLPNDGTWVLTYDGISQDVKTDYQVTQGSALSHITNLCQYAGWEWMCWMENDTYTVSSVSGTDVTFSGSIGSSDKYQNGFGSIITGDGKNGGFAIESVSGNTITANKSVEDLGLEVDDKVTLWGRNVLYITERLGTDTTIISATQNFNCSNLQFATIQDKVFTHILSSGVTASTLGYTSVATANNTSFATVDCDESFLVIGATAGATCFWIYDGSSYEYPLKYQIEDEIVSVQQVTNFGTSWRVNMGVTTNRGLNGSTATAHNMNTPLLNWSRFKASNIGSTFLSSGTVWIGMEKIEYSGLDYGAFTNLTRGVDSTRKYFHKKGTLIRDAQYDDTPAPLSMAAATRYGIRSGRFEANGFTSLDSIDHYVGSVLLKTSNASERGTFTYLDTDLWKAFTLGDNVSVTRSITSFNDSGLSTKSTATATYRIKGVHYKQFQPMDIEFGELDNYILDSFQKVDYSKDLAAQKGQNPISAKVIQVSSDKKTVLVEYEDGTQEWVRSGG